MDEACYLDAEITPARSLSRRGLRRLMIAISLSALPPVVVGLFVGAPLVIPFVAAAVLGLWFAFSVMNRKVVAERVRVSSELVEVFRAGKAVWASAPAFTRVEPGESAVRLSMSGRGVAVARALSPVERREFAGALDAAIRRARNERYG